MLRALPSLAIVVVAASATAARADAPTGKVAVADGISVSVHDYGAYVSRGPYSVSLGTGTFNGPIEVDRKARTVTFPRENDCSGAPIPVVTTFDELTSKLDNAAAYGLHRQHHYAEAATGFTAALAHDPKNRTAAVNLASARQLLGDRAAAVAALTPWLASDPIEMYATIIGDPELAPLLDGAVPSELATLRAPVIGDVVVDATGLAKGGIAYSPARNQIAIGRAECSWGKSPPDACSIDIEIFAPAGGPRVASLPVVFYDDTKHGVVAQRAATAQRVLRDFGFALTPTVVATEISRDDQKARYALASLKLGIVGKDGSVNVVRGNSVLAHAEVLDHLRGAAYVPAAHALAVFSGRAGREGCEGTDPTRTTIIPLTP